MATIMGRGGSKQPQPHPPPSLPQIRQAGRQRLERDIVNPGSLIFCFLFLFLLSHSRQQTTASVQTADSRQIASRAQKEHGTRLISSLNRAPHVILQYQVADRRSEIRQGTHYYSVSVPASTCLKYPTDCANQEQLWYSFRVSYCSKEIRSRDNQDRDGANCTCE